MLLEVRNSGVGVSDDLAQLSLSLPGNLHSLVATVDAAVQVATWVATICTLKAQGEASGLRFKLMYQLLNSTESCSNIISVDKDVIWQTRHYCSSLRVLSR